MIVKNILKICAEYLDLKEVLKYLNEETEADDQISEDVNNLLLGLNMVNNTIASSYIELIGQKEVVIDDHITKYSVITDKSIIEIKSVSTMGGNKINFKILPEGLKLNYLGKCNIEYSYFPDKLSIDSKIDYYLKLNEITMAIGVVSEYLYIKGMIDDAYMWDKRFKNTMFNLLRPKRNIVMPSNKRW